MAGSNAASKDGKKSKPMPKKQLLHFEKRLLQRFNSGLELGVLHVSGTES